MLVTIFLRAAERAPKSLVVGAERLYLLFGHVACDLAGLRAEDWLDSGNLVARLNLPYMDPGTVDRVDFDAAAARSLFELEPDAALAGEVLGSSTSVLRCCEKVRSRPAPGDSR